jgi:ATP-dependent DNA helicase DinG
LARTWRQLSVGDVLGPKGLLARVHPNFESRPAQLEMAEAVAESLKTGGALAVEAPTGVGKTLAYLVPALLSERRVIVSTNTKTLQEQIIDKDIPLLERVFRSAQLVLRRAEPERGAGRPGLVEPEWVRRGTEQRAYALMKGRSNYLCKERFVNRQRALFERAEDRALLDELEAWVKTSLRGDKAELSRLEEGSPLWDELDARPEVCLGTRCARYDECFVVRMRHEAENADLIVVNHHLLMADLTVRAEAALAGDRAALGEVIPRADAVVVDEAHAIEEVASEYFGGEASRRKAERLLHDTVSWLAERGRPGAFDPRPARLAPSGPGSDALALKSSEAVGLVEKTFQLLPRAEGRLRITPPGVERDPFLRARQASEVATSVLGELSETFGDRADDDPAAESLCRRARGLADALRFVLGAADPDFVYWAEHTKKTARIGAAPIAVDDLLRSHVFAAFETVVLTSATLATATSDRGGFRYFLDRIGAPEQTRAIQLETPFDYAGQVALYVPGRLPTPDAPGFLDAICRTGESLIQKVGGGAFFLFTSHRMMRLAHQRLAPRLPFPVLLQGEAPKRELLRAFVDRTPAVLFATASFWEGVDVPGDPLRLVLIDRLPFASPSDPVVAARLERLAARGEDPFSAYQVPQAILRLRQGFGRLVRRSSDRGVVAILDARLSTRAYGRRFLAALPGAALIRDPAGLDAWLLARGMLAPTESGPGPERVAP